jgi:hypothetical protein
VGSNKWLESREFLENVDFPDKLYFRILAKEVANFLKNCPVHIITWWVAKNSYIEFFIGQSIHWSVQVDTDISYRDYIVKIEKYAKKYYPQYSVVKETTEALNEDEIILLLQKNKDITFEDAVARSKTITLQENGIIERVYMKEDEFTININGERTQRMSGIPIKKPMPLKNFMESLRAINASDSENKDYEIRNYIFENSHERRKLIKRKETIDFIGMQMISFFKINFSLLREFELKKTGKLNYSWGDCDIKFDSPTTEEQCLSTYKKLMENINVPD